jgi:hypothetical protein
LKAFLDLLANVEISSFEMSLYSLIISSVAGLTVNIVLGFFSLLFVVLFFLKEHY